MKLVEFPLQDAIYKRIKDALGVPVFDFVPEDEPFPYVEIGEIMSVSDNGKHCFRSIATVPIHVWDSAGSMGYNTRINQIGNDILEAVTVGDDNAFLPLILPDHTVIRQDCPDGMKYIPNPDDSIRHGNLNFEIWVSEN